MNYSSYYFTTSTPYDNYNETEDLISFSLTTGSSGTLTFTPLVTTINTDISLSLVIVGGGGGGASSGQNGSNTLANMSWGSGSGGGGAGFGKITLKNIITSYTYTIGSGGIGGVGTTKPAITGVDGANGGNSTFTTPHGNIVAEGGRGAPSLWTVYGPPPQAGTAGTLTYPSNPDIIAINDCSGGNGGIGVNNDSSPVNYPTAGSNSTPNQTIEIYDSYNVSFGGGGGGGDASTSPQYDSGTEQWTAPTTSNNGGKAGLDGIGGGIGSTGTLTDKDGENATTYGAGGGGAGQAGINDSPFSINSSYWYNNGGKGGSGILYITFYKPPIIFSYTDGINIYSSNYDIGVTTTLTPITTGTPTSFTLVSGSQATLNTNTGELTFDTINMVRTSGVLKIRCSNIHGKSNIFTLNYVLNSCTWNTDLSGQSVNWSRANTAQGCVSVEPSKLDERRKAEIFKYKNNSANFSRKQNYARFARGFKQRGQTFATQTPDYTNSNIRELKLGGVNGPLLCKTGNTYIANSRQNNVPGPTTNIAYDPTVPLTRYVTRRTYSGGSEKWPQYGPNTGQARLAKWARNTGTKPGMFF